MSDIDHLKGHRDNERGPQCVTNVEIADSYPDPTGLLHAHVWDTSAACGLISDTCPNEQQDI